MQAQPLGSLSRGEGTQELQPSACMRARACVRGCLTSADLTPIMALRTASATSSRTAWLRQAFGIHAMCTNGIVALGGRGSRSTVRELTLWSSFLHS